MTPLSIIVWDDVSGEPSYVERIALQGKTIRIGKIGVSHCIVHPHLAKYND